MRRLIPLTPSRQTLQIQSKRRPGPLLPRRRGDQASGHRRRYIAKPLGIPTISKFISGMAKDLITTRFFQPPLRAG
jgi:hypothetical protein